MKNYNGWTNRETWLVGAHYEINTIDELNYIKDKVESMYDEINKISSFLADYVDFSLINWAEIESHIDEEEMENEY